MSRFCPLFSSSKGNSVYLSGGGTSLLVDAGVSFRRLRMALEAQAVDPSSLSGLLITHEHSDHIGGLKTLLKRLDIPVFASPGTLEYLCRKDYIPPDAVVVAIEDAMTVGGVRVTPFPTSHDAWESLGFRFDMPDGRKLAVATDLGMVTPVVRSNLEGCDLVMLESNYDRGMLDVSDYPYYLKRRIRGTTGHLSNEDCAAELAGLIRKGATRLVLGHLSEQNNLPQLARQLVLATMDAEGMREEDDYILQVAPASGPGEMMVL